MKIIFVFAFLIFIHNIHGDINEGLILYYPFDEDANDQSGNGRNGAIVGEIGPVDDEYFDFSMDPSNLDFVDAPDIDFPFGQDFSVSLLIYVPQEPVSAGLIDARLSTYYGWSLWLYGLNTSFGGRCDNATNTHGVVAQQVIIPGQWHHIAAVVDWSANRVFFYVNGLLIEPESGRGTLENCNGFRRGSQIRIGHLGPPHGNSGYQAYNYNGMVDEFRIYNRALTESEIQLLLPSTNSLPVADAGPNLTVPSSDLQSTIITGSATDPDEGDILSYRWTSGADLLKDWSQILPDNTCPLELSTVSLGLGQHTLTLEVSDGTDEESDFMILTVGNSAPTVSMNSGAGTYEFLTPVELLAEVSDFDGDIVNYEYKIDGQVLCADEVATILEGASVSLPPCIVNELPIGEHNILLSVYDGSNPAVIEDINVHVVDYTVPTLAPVVNKSILWPPNHKMVNIRIESNASDNSGVVNLSATVSSDEPQEGPDDDDVFPDWTNPHIDSETGIITLQLRAERLGGGDGRVYKVIITATDESENWSTANVEIKVPHDKGKKK